MSYTKSLYCKQRLMLINELKYEYVHKFNATTVVHCHLTSDV